MSLGRSSLSADYRVIGINKYAAEILQINPSDIGKKIYKYHSPRIHARIKHLLNKACNAANDIPPPVIMNVRDNVLAVNLCRIDIRESPARYFYNMSFIDITGQGIGRDRRKPVLKSIPVYEGGSYLFLDISSVHLIKSEGNYCRVFTDGEQYYLRATLNEIEKKYTGKSLFRVHRGFIVNLDKIHRITEAAAGAHNIDFKNKNFPRAPVARRRFNGLKEALGLVKG
jgi:DNA-binding LytR/AlgR family response regulator